MCVVGDDEVREAGDAAKLRAELAECRQALAELRERSDRRAEAELARSQELLQLLFEGIPVLLVMWDPRLRRFTLNRHAEAVLGWTTEDANTGAFMSKVYPDPAYRAKVAAVMRSLRPGWREWVATTRRGERVPINWANIRLGDDTMIGIGVDLRERKRAEEAQRDANAQLEEQAVEMEVANEELQAQREELEVANEELKVQTEELQAANQRLQESQEQERERGEALRRSEERLTRTQAIAHLGSWELDLTTNRLTWSDEVYRIFGLRPQEFGATYEAFLAHVHPDDRAAVDAAYTGSLREGRDSYEIEHRVVRRATGEVRWVHEKCEHIRDASGRIIRSVGMVHDITERKRAEDELARLSQQRQLALDAAHMGWWHYDPVSRVASWDDGYRRIFGVAGYERPNDEILAQIIHPEDLPALWAKVEAALDPRDPQPYAAQYRIRRPDGLTRWIEAHGIASFEERGDERHATSFVGTVADITERKEAEAERERLLEAAQRARAEAEEANAAKDQFVALVSHELRNPLNAITAGIAFLRQSCPMEGRAARSLEIVERNAALQARLVNDLLDLSRLQRGKLQLQRAPVDLARVVAAACHSYQAEAQEAGLTLTCDSAPGTWVYGDFDRLHQVVANILSNAVKFTPRGGRVSVACSTFNAQRSEAPPFNVERGTLNVARVAVEDTGIGLDRALQDHLFEAFRQGEVAGREKPGLGLGLALVKEIVERHGGRVWAESEGPGRGSRFVMELPLVEGSGFKVPGSGGVATKAEPRAGGLVRVLLVEDSADARTMIANSLALSGYEVRAAGSGEEALEVLREVCPDVMLVDIGLPGINGFEFLERARALPGIADVPAFAVTGFGAEEDVRRGRAVGFAGHFVKPVDVRALEERLREWVGAEE